MSETVLLSPTESLTPVLFITGLMCERAPWVAKAQRYEMAVFAGAPSFGG